MWLTRDSLWAVIAIKHMEPQGCDTGCEELPQAETLEHPGGGTSTFSCTGGRLGARPPGGADGASLVASTLGKISTVGGKTQTNKTHSAQL